MTKRLIIAIALLVLFSTYKLQNFFFDTKLNIKEIIIENNNVLKDSEIKKDLTPIYNTNLLFLNVNYIKEILLHSDTLCTHFINADYIKKIVNEHLDEGKNHRLLIWSFLNFEWWCRIFLED